MISVVRGGFVALYLASLCCVGSAAAQSEAAKAFGAREMVRHASLSPDGQSVALVQPLAEGQAYGLFVATAGASGFKPILTTSGRPERLGSCNWVSNSRLVCNVYFFIEKDAMRLGYDRLVAIDSDGTNLKVLTARPSGREYSYLQDGGDIVDWLAGDSSGSVLMTRSFRQEYSTGTNIGNKREGLAVERIDTLTLRRSLQESPRSDAVRYISDQHGAVRLYARRQTSSDGYMRAKLQYFYRTKPNGPFAEFGLYDEEAHTGILPVAVDRDLNAAYGYEWINGRRALVRVALDGSLKREIVLTHDRVDVDELITIGRQRRVVGAGFATDRRHAEFFDPALKTLAASLSKALPGQPPVRFLDASLDETILLFWAGADVDPGRYYLYDKTKRSISPVIDDRPHLASYKLAPVRPVSYRAADGTMIPAYLTSPVDREAKNLPAIVLPHGGPGSRDELGFDWLAQYFANQGYAVLQPNFRGSAGYGEAWFQENGFKSWRTAVGDVNDAGRWLLSENIAAPGKLAIVGWSYGGYAALQSGVLDPDLFRAVVAVAPVTDLDALREESRRFTNFRLVDAYIGRGPHITEGSPADNAGKLKAPVLLFHGDEDTNVGIRQSRLMQAKLAEAGRPAELIVFPGLDHQLDDSTARAQLLDRSNAFIRGQLGF